jgi:hypothetical protein
VAEPVDATAARASTSSATGKAKFPRENRGKARVFREKTRFNREKTRFNREKAHVNREKARTIPVAEPVEATAARASTSSATEKAKFTRENRELSRDNCSKTRAFTVAEPVKATTIAVAEPVEAVEAVEATTTDVPASGLAQEGEHVFLVSFDPGLIKCVDAEDAGRDAAGKFVEIE